MIDESNATPSGALSAPCPGRRDVSNAIWLHHPISSNSTLAASRCAACGAISLMVRLPSMASNSFFCCQGMCDACPRGVSLSSLACAQGQASHNPQHQRSVTYHDQRTASVPPIRRIRFPEGPLLTCGHSPDQRQCLGYHSARLSANPDACRPKISGCRLHPASTTLPESRLDFLSCLVTLDKKE